MEDVKVPGWAKILVGTAIIVVCVWKLPLLEMFWLFFYVVLIPLVFLSAIGMIGSGTIEYLGGSLQGISDRVQREIHEARTKKDGEAAPSPN